VTAELPSLSVVTPSYNQAGFLEESLRSVHGQGYPRLEHQVMDGGSTDGSVAILERCQRGVGRVFGKIGIHRVPSKKLRLPGPAGACCCPRVARTAGQYGDQPRNAR